MEQMTYTLICACVAQLWCKTNLSINSLLCISEYFYLQEENNQFRKPWLQVTVFPRDNLQRCAMQFCNSNTWRNSACPEAQIPGFHTSTLFLSQWDLWALMAAEHCWSCAPFPNPEHSVSSAAERAWAAQLRQKAITPNHSPETHSGNAALLFLGLKCIV